MKARWHWPIALCLLVALSAGAGWLFGALTSDSSGNSAASSSIAASDRPAPVTNASTAPPLSRSKRPPKHPASALSAPLSGFLISVDPGHNGGNATHPEEIARPVVAYADGSTKPCNTTGTETDDGFLTEAEFNFDVATDLVHRLRALGARIVMTRDDNVGVGPCVDQRAETANRAHADLAISIHADGNVAEGAQGFDVIRPAAGELVDPRIAAPSKALAEDLRNALVDAGAPIANYVGDQGLDVRDDLGGLNLSRVPVSMVELGNMRSTQEALRLESPAYRERLAQGLAAGISAFLSRGGASGD
jgi:N-acetylmuramoyl-L-alanine amidase